MTANIQNQCTGRSILELRDEHAGNGDESSLGSSAGYLLITGGIRRLLIVNRRAHDGNLPGTAYWLPLSLRATRRRERCENANKTKVCVHNANSCHSLKIWRGGDSTASMARRPHRAARRHVFNRFVSWILHGQSGSSLAREKRNSGFEDPLPVTTLRITDSRRNYTCELL